MRPGLKFRDPVIYYGRMSNHTRDWIMKKILPAIHSDVADFSVTHRAEILQLTAGTLVPVQLRSE